MRRELRSMLSRSYRAPAPPLRRIVECRLDLVGVWWDVLACGHRVWCGDRWGEHPMRRRCETCVQVEDSAQLRLF